jgi:hypothetical protein
MKLFNFRSLFATASIVMLTACGAGMDSDELSRPDTAAPFMQTSYAPGQPAPDCAADGCTAPRPVDGLADEFRVAAMERGAVAPDNAPQATEEQPQAAGADSGTASSAPVVTDAALAQ